MTRWTQVLPAAVLLVTLWLLQPATVAEEDAAASSTKVACRAATPVPNPWTRKCPPGWWMKRHEEILADPGREDARLVFIGDSITKGWDSEGAGLKVWKTEFAPLNALNLGVNCDSTQHVLWRLDNGEMNNLSKLKAVVIQIGTNNQGITRDPPEDIAKGIEAICARVKQKAPQARILILAIFPKGFGTNRHDIANDLISKLADGKQVHYLDINEALVSGKGIADRVGHLNERGFEIWAEKIRPVIREMME